MSTFKKTKKQLPGISTASLPDIVFMLLFFFMTVTTFKSEALWVENELPNATHVHELDKKERVIEIYVGAPKEEYKDQYGTVAKIQMNERLIAIDQVPSVLLTALNEKPEAIRPFVTVSLKVDKAVTLGIVQDLKEKLRDINLLKVNYTTYQGNDAPILK